MRFTDAVVTILAVGATAAAVPVAAVDDVTLQAREADPAFGWLGKLAKGGSSMAEEGKRLQAAANVPKGLLTTTLGHAKDLRLPSVFTGKPIGSVRTQEKREAEAEADPAFGWLGKLAKGGSSMAEEGKRLQAAANVPKGLLTTTLGHAKDLRLPSVFTGKPIGSVRTQKRFVA